MTDEVVVPDDADESYDPGYNAVADASHGDEELGDVPDEAVQND
jgi:hypothetical protein